MFVLDRSFLIRFWQNFLKPSWQKIAKVPGARPSARKTGGKYATSYQLKILAAVSIQILLPSGLMIKNDGNGYKLADEKVA
jgi:hypothetical protein